MKAVRVNEIRRSGSVVRSIGVGKKHVIMEWLEGMGLDVNLATINDDVVDYDGDIRLTSRGMKTLTNDLFRFGKVNGTFSCEDNYLTSLKGAPEEVTNYFICDNNQLTSLEFGPKRVGGTFSCGGNKLTSLVHGPTEVGIDYQCENNLLQNLIGMPEHDGYGSVWVQSNQLKSLVGCPQYINVSFYCHDNKLKNLMGGPRFVGETYDCRKNSAKFTKEYVMSTCKVNEDSIEV